MGWELPGIVPFEATKKLIKDHILKWESPSIACSDSVVAEAELALDVLSYQHFGQFPKLQGLIR